MRYVADHTGSVPLSKIPALIYLWKNDESSDSTWNAVVPSIWFQISLNLSLITACVPSLKPVFDSLFGYTAGAVVQAPDQPGTENYTGGDFGAMSLDPDGQARWVELTPSSVKAPRESSRKSKRATTGSGEDKVSW